MRLKLNEITYLRQYFDAPSGISFFNNVQKGSDGTEGLSLLEKRVVNDKGLEETALKPLSILAYATANNRIYLKNRFGVIEKYLYFSDEGTLLLENMGGEFEVNLLNESGGVVGEYAQWLGRSNAKTVHFNVWLNFKELTLLSLIFDFMRKEALKGLAGNSEMKFSFNLSEIQNEIKQPIKDSLFISLTHNYGLPTPKEDDLKEAFLGLKTKGVVEGESSYQLEPSYEMFSKVFLMPDNLLLLEGIQSVEGDAIEVANFAAFGDGLYDWLCMVFDEEGVDVFTASALDILSLIEGQTVK